MPFKLEVDTIVSMSNEDYFFLGLKALIQNPDGKLLLLKRPSLASDIPGGRIQKGEKLEGALKREVFEETALEITTMAPFFMFVTNVRIQDLGLIISSYLCEVTSISKVQLSSEHIDFKWADLSEASKCLSSVFSQEFADKISILA